MGLASGPPRDENQLFAFQELIYIMTLFYSTHSRSTKIDIDPLAVSSSSPSVQKRMDRIAENYQQLDLLLAEVEAKIQRDARLNAIDQSICEVELDTGTRQKTWRRRKKSAAPKKPR